MREFFCGGNSKILNNKSPINFSAIDFVCRDYQTSEMQIIRLGDNKWYMFINNKSILKSLSLLKTLTIHLKVFSIEKLKFVTLKLLDVSANGTTWDSSRKSVLIKNGPNHTKKTHNSLSIVSVGKKSDPQKLIDRWSAADDIFCHSIKRCYIPFF